MKKRLLTIKIKVVQGDKSADIISAIVYKTGEDKIAEIFQFVLSKNENIFSKQDYVSNRFELVKLKVMDELRTQIDNFVPSITSIEILEDSHNLLKKLTMCCPDCGRKFYESWGKIKGIVTKCHRCRSICIPIEKY